MNDTISNFFNDPKKGFVDVNKLYQKMKEEGHKVTFKQIKDWYDSQAVNQIYKQPKIPEKYNKIVCPFNSVGCLQIDLMDISNVSEHNKGFHFILNCVDIYSRYVWSFALKNKSANTTHDSIEKIIKEIKKIYPDNTITITTDEGLEFEGKNKELIKKYKIMRFYADPRSITNHTHMAIVERYNRTLLNKIRKYQQITNSLSYIDKLDDFTENYNKTKHSTIKLKPYVVFHKDLKYIQDEGINNKPDNELMTGDYVRVIQKIKRFEKKTTAQKYSEAIYQVVEKKGLRYSIKNKTDTVLKKTYLYRELLKINKPIEETPHVTPIIRTNKIVNKRVRLQKKEFKPGHEIKEVTDDGEIILKDRLLPTNTKRISKPTKRLIL